jgi:hypothetical protein
MIAGHSRGGKLAALHYAAGCAPCGLPLKAAFLLDPVDNTRQERAQPVCCTVQVAVIIVVFALLRGSSCTVMYYTLTIAPHQPCIL